MNKFLPTFLPLLLAIGIGLPVAVEAGSTDSKSTTAAVKPFEAVEEATISSITASSITVTHLKEKPAKAGKKPASRAPAPTKNTTRGKGAGKTTDTSHEKVTKTYQITGLTDVEIDGQKAAVSALHPGMAVSISADPPTSLSPADDSDGGTARTILAHDAPEPQTTPAPVAKRKK